MEKVREILKQLSNTDSTNEKKEIIRANKDNFLFLSVLKYALDDGKKYGLKNFDNCKEYSVVTDGTSTVFKELDMLANKHPGKSKHRLHSIALALNCVDVVELILNKDLRCGVGARLVNDVIPRWVDIVPYQRYKSMKYLENIDFNNDIVAQLKMNGLFSYRLSDGLFVTRNNKSYRVSKYKLTQDYNDLINLLHEPEPIVFVGEGLIMGKDYGFLNRQTSNGIVNSFIQGGGEELKNYFCHVVWYYLLESEYYAGKSTVTYKERFTKLQDAFDSCANLTRVKLVDTVKVHSLAEAQDWYKKVRAGNEEGCIIKDTDNLVWEDDKSGSKYGVKMKAEAEVEVRIVEAYYGKVGKKYEDYLGGLVVESSDSKIISKVGMGFSDEQRELGVAWWNSKKGKIVTICFTELTQARGSSTYAFGNARFIESRFTEKDEADSYDRCVEILSCS